MKLRDLALDIIANVFGGCIGALACGLAYFALVRVAPAIETSISPIVHFEPVDDIYRDPKKTCFALHITKLVAAFPLKYTFELEAKLSEPIHVSAYLADKEHREVASDLENHKVGSSWTRRYCFETPATISDKQPFRVTGRSIHRRHPLYDSPTNIPGFIVPAILKLSDPDQP